MNSPELVHTLQTATYWARGQALELNRVGTGFAKMEDGLFIPLDEASRQEFERGDGRELRRMHSLRSSSALAFNVFAPWKPDPTPLGEVLGGSGPYETIRFERKYPTGVSSRHPHLDVVLDGAGLPIAVESKFVEVYDEPKPAQFSRRYLDASGLWAGMPNLRALATKLEANPMTFHRLGAAQLIKHSLGLAREYGHEGFRLIYLWYDFFSETAVTHRREVERFAEPASQDIAFTALTHQQLFGELSQIEEPAPGYVRYLAGRYGLG